MSMNTKITNKISIPIQQYVKKIHVVFITAMQE